MTLVNDQLKLLQRQKQQAVRQENYDEAQRLKSIIDGLKAVQDDVEKLELEKLRAVKEERYDDAKQAKQKVDNLLESILGSLDQTSFQEKHPVQRSTPSDR